MSKTPNQKADPNLRLVASVELDSSLALAPALELRLVDVDVTVAVVAAAPALASCSAPAVTTTGKYVPSEIATVEVLGGTEVSDSEAVHWSKSDPD